MCDYANELQKLFEYKALNSFKWSDYFFNSDSLDLKIVMHFTDLVKNIPSQEVVVTEFLLYLSQTGIHYVVYEFNHDLPFGTIKRFYKNSGLALTLIDGYTIVWGKNRSILKKDLFLNHLNITESLNEYQNNPLDSFINAFEEFGSVRCNFFNERVDIGFYNWSSWYFNYIVSQLEQLLFKLDISTEGNAPPATSNEVYHLTGGSNFFVTWDLFEDLSEEQPYLFIDSFYLNEKTFRYRLILKHENFDLLKETVTKFFDSLDYFFIIRSAPELTEIFVDKHDRITRGREIYKLRSYLCMSRSGDTPFRNPENYRLQQAIRNKMLE